MAESDWTTTSVKLERDLKLKLNKYCDVEGITSNKLIKGLIKRKLAFMLKPTAIRTDEGISVLAKHEFKYDIQEDTFDWLLDLGDGQKHCLSENIGVDFLEKLKQAIDDALEEYKTAKKKLGKKTVVPGEVLDYEVE